MNPKIFYRIVIKLVLVMSKPPVLDVMVITHITDSGPQTTASASPWEWLEMQTLRPHPDPLNQNLRFNKAPRWSWILKLEKCWNGH